MDKWNEKYRINTTRLKFHDYSGGFYHVVICTKDKMNLFAEIVKNGNQNVINYYEIGLYLYDCISKMTLHSEYAVPILWQVMPNHVHILLYIDGEKVPYDRRIVSNITNCNDIKVIDSMKGWLSVAIGGLKSAVSVYAIKNKIPFAWQSRFYDVLITNENQYNYTLEYISNNVNTWINDSLYNL